MEQDTEKKDTTIVSVSHFDRSHPGSYLGAQKKRYFRSKKCRAPLPKS